MGIGSNGLENPEFKNFIMMIRPAYKPPSRKTFTSKLLPSEYHKTVFQVNQAVTEAPFVTLCSDGFSDIARNHVYNVICCTPTPFLWKTIDTTAHSETAAYLTDVIGKEIEVIGPSKVTAIISDHAANIRAALRNLQLQYPWLLVEGCRAHLLNLLARDICDKAFVKEYVQICTKITKFFRYHHFSR